MKKRNVSIIYITVVTAVVSGVIILGLTELYTTVMEAVISSLLIVLLYSFYLLLKQLIKAKGVNDYLRERQEELDMIMQENTERLDEAERMLRETLL